MDYNKLALELHEKYKGKITTSLRDKEELNRDKLSAYYSPGVGAVSQAIAENPADLPKYTWTNNLVAVISDGSAILGLGNLGPKAAMPVMEGKALLFKHFADVDAVPIVLDVHEPEEIIATVKAIAPSFGAINLEDIAAPKCFEIEERLKAELDIPVFHDDQHGTAVVVLAGLINAAKLTGRNLADCKFVVIGAGAAGTAIIKLLNLYGAKNIVAVDSRGIVGKSLVQKMAKDPIVFALANPVPEIMPDVAKQAGVAIIGTGRSDFPNQVNNSLAFPGIFRGALDHGVKKITDQHKLAAAEALANLVENPTVDKVVPTAFDEGVVEAIANVIR